MRLTVSALSASPARLVASAKRGFGVARRIGCKRLVNLAARLSETGVGKGIWSLGGRFRRLSAET